MSNIINNRKKILIILLLLIVVHLVIDSICFDKTKRKTNKLKFNTVYVIADYKKVAEKEKITDELLTDRERVLNIVKTQDSVTKKDNKYYVAKLNNINPIVFKNINETIFALNDLNGNKIEDLKFNKEKKEVLIPKKYFEEKKYKKEYGTVPVQMEILSRVKKSQFNNIKISIKKNGIILNKNKNYYVNANDMNTEISIYKYRKGLSVTKGDIKVYLNSSKNPLNKDLYHYNNRIGKISIDIEPIYINDVKIQIKKSKQLYNVLNIFHLDNVGDVESDTTRIAGTYKVTSGSFSAAKLGTITTTTAKLPYIYGSSIAKYNESGWKKGAVFCGGDIGDYNCNTKNYFANADDNNKVLSSIKKAFKNSASAKHSGEDGETNLDGFLIDISRRDGKTITDGTNSILIELDKNWIRLFCAHLDEDATQNNGSAGMTMTLTYSKDGDRIKIHAQSEATAGGQFAVGDFYVVADDTPVSLKIQKKLYKVDGNGSIDVSSPTDMGQQGIVFDLYSKVNAAGTGCKNYIKSASTNDKGVATFKNLEAGVIYCIEESYLEDDDSSSISNRKYVRFNYLKNNRYITKMTPNSGGSGEDEQSTYYDTEKSKEFTTENIGKWIDCKTEKDKAVTCEYFNLEVKGCNGFYIQKVDAQTNEYLTSASLSGLLTCFDDPIVQENMLSTNGAFIKTHTTTCFITNIEESSTPGNKYFQPSYDVLKNGFSTMNFAGFIEYTASGNYHINCDGAPSTPTATIKNYRKYQCLAVKKVDKTTRKPLKGAKLTSTCKNSANEVYTSTKVTDDNGTAVFYAGLNSDADITSEDGWKYTNPNANTTRCEITEESAPEGYAKTNAKLSGLTPKVFETSSSDTSVVNDIEDECKVENVEEIVSDVSGNVVVITKAANNVFTNQKYPISDLSFGIIEKRDYKNIIHSRIPIRKCDIPENIGVTFYDDELNPLPPGSYYPGQLRYFEITDTTKQHKFNCSVNIDYNSEDVVLGIYTTKEREFAEDAGAKVYKNYFNNLRANIKESDESYKAAIDDLIDKFAGVEEYTDLMDITSEFMKKHTTCVPTHINTYSSSCYNLKNNALNEMISNVTTKDGFYRILLNDLKNNYCNVNDNVIENCRKTFNFNFDVSTFESIAEFENIKNVINWKKYLKTTTGTTTSTNGSAGFKVKKTDTGKYIKVTSAKEQYTDSKNVTKNCYVFDSFVDSKDSATQLETSSGEACVMGLEDGNYEVEEISAPTSHTFDNITKITLTASADFSTANNIFSNPPTRFEFSKTIAGKTEYSDEEMEKLKNLRFSIYKKGSNQKLEFVKNTDTKHYDYKANSPKFSTATAVTDLQLNDDRKILVDYLPVGDYDIKENTEDENTCNGGGFYHASYDNESDYRFTIKNTYNSIAKQSLENVVTELYFTKKDIYKYANANKIVKFETSAGIDEISIFDKITFKLKDTKGNYLTFRDDGNEGDCSDESSTSNYSFDSSSTTTELHTCGGNLKIKSLCNNSTYILEETAVPNNTLFILPDKHPTVTYEVPEDGDATTSENNKREIDDTPTNIEIQKTDNRTNGNVKESNDRKETAKFKVYKCDKSVSKCIYDLSDKKEIKFENLAKIANNTENSEEKVYKFKLDQTASGGVTELNLNENGKIILRYLPAGYKYVVVETNAPDGFYNVTGELANLQINIPTNTTNNSATRVNYPTFIRFKKDDLYKYYKKSDQAQLNDNTKIFDSMTFVLHDEKGNIVKLKKIQDGEYRFIQNDGSRNNTVEELHTINGEMLITHLYRNETYYLEETKTDPEGNFILPENINNTSLVESKAGNLKNNKHPIVRYDIPNELPSASSLNDAPESLTELIDNNPTRVVFEKRDKRTNELINDSIPDEEGVYSSTTFQVYKCDKSVEYCTVDNGTLVYFTDRTYIKDSSGKDITSDITSVTPPVLAYKYSKLNSSSGAVSDLHTDRGVLALAYLPSKYKYVLYETVAPNGYYNPRKIEAQTEFTVKDSSLTSGETYETLTERVSNEPTEIMFIKSDLYDYYNSEDIAKIDSEEKLFDTARFVLRDSNGDILKLKYVETNEEEGNVYRYLKVNEDNYINEIKTYKGKLKITHLYRSSTYYIEEIKTTDPKHFILPDYLNFSNLPFDNKGHPVVKYDIPENKPYDATTVTREIENIPTRVVFHKRDSKYNYLVPDETVTFNVYQCGQNEDGTNKECHPTDYMVYDEKGNIDRDATNEKMKAEDITLITFTKRAVITGDQEDPLGPENEMGLEVYKYAKLNKGKVIDLHPQYGVLVLRYLPAGYNYVLVETVAGKNYMMPIGQNAETPFTVADNKVAVDQVDIPNKPTSILIRKYSDKGDLLPGAEFKIYHGTQKDEEGNYVCNKNLSPMNQPKEEMKFKVIRDGVYEYRPELTDSIVKTCEDEANGICSNIPTNESTDLTFNAYEGTWAEWEETTTAEGKSIEIQEGEALIQYLEYGNCYIIEEVKAPEGYSLPSKKEDRFSMVYIEENDSYYHDTETDLINKPTPFTFYKYDEFNKLLDGAEFKLQKLDDNKKYHDVPVDLNETGEDGTLYYKVNEDGENYTMKTHNGSATVYFLRAGQYRIVETKAAPGKELTKNPNIATFFVDSNGNVYGNAVIVNKKKTEKIEVKPTASAELIVNIQTGQTVIRYGLIISLLTAGILGLMIYKRKRK